MERLSTGIRINSAKDDAAGLAISARMTAKLRGISAAVRNAHDGLSILETAESGLNTISNAIQRMRELAVQSANSTNNSNDRASLNLEAKQLSAEIDRVASCTTFNGIKLLDGSFQNKPLQIGPDSIVNDSISISIDSAKISSLGFGASTRTVSISSGQGTANPLAAGDLIINGFLVGATQPDGVSFSGNTASGISRADAINAISGVTGVVAKAAPTTISGSLITDTSTLINSGDIKVNGVNIGVIGPAGSAIVRSSQIAAAINTTSAQTGVIAKYTLDGKVSLTAIDGRNITVDSALSGNVTGLGSAGTTRSIITLTSTKPEGVTISNLNVGASVVGLNSGVYLSSTNTSPSITYTASTSGNPVGSTALNLGDLSINGVAISAAASSSAKDIATAINQKTSLSGVKATAIQTKSTSTTPKGTVSSSINLGALGNLINPIKIDGGKYYYFWDKNGDGSELDRFDVSTHDQLDLIFNEDINGGLNPAQDTTDTFRYATLNGIRVALPTYGGGLDGNGNVYVPTNGDSYGQAGTSIGSTRGLFSYQVTDQINLLYDDLWAISDAFNGTSVGNQAPFPQDVPLDWKGPVSYWSSTPISQGMHIMVTLGHGVSVAKEDFYNSNVALQVFSPPENFNSIASDAIQINGVNIGEIATASSSSERATQMITAINIQTASTGVTATLNTTTGGITLTAADGRNIDVSTLTSANISGSSIGVALNGTISGNRTATTFRSSVDLTSTSANGLSIVSTGNGATASGLSSITIAATGTSTPGNNSASSQTSTSELDLSTVDGSKAAITLLDVALNKLTNVRATLGAFQNRLLAAIQNLDTTAMNLAASRSRILDTDYAIETTNVAKAQIIQQAATAMLAQANQSNQSVLALLKS